MATGAAGFSDMLNYLKLPYSLALWSCFGRCPSIEPLPQKFLEKSVVLTGLSCLGTMAPAIGPIVAGFSVPAKGWHWSQWELLWLSAPIAILLFTMLPETSSDTILLRRASRLRKITGDLNLRSASEIKMQHLSAKEMAFNTLIKPWEINALDPAILFTTLYSSLCYAIFYSFFEVYPFVFPAIYGFSLGESGIAFLAVPVGVLLTVPVTLAHYGFRVEPRLAIKGSPAPEVWLRPGLIGIFFVSIGLFIFG